MHGLGNRKALSVTHAGSNPAGRLAGSRARLLEAIHDAATRNEYRWVKAGDKIDATMATLPNHENAVINEQKLSGYALDSEHPVGGHKARKFKSALGFESAHVKEIVEQIRGMLPSSEATKGRADHHVQRFSVDMPLTGPNGSATVRTAWIIEQGSEAPRWVTIYVKES